MSIGETLADARRQAGLSVTQVSQETRIRESIISAIEQNDYSPCGGDFYARGHIRSIARVVGADPAPLIREYDEDHGPPGSISAADVFESTTPIRIREPRRVFGLGKVMVALLLAVIGGASYYLASGHQHAHVTATPPRATVPPVTKPKATVKPATTPKAKPEAVIVLTAHQDCWVGLTNTSGKQLYQGIVLAGHKMTWHEAHKVSMKLGNPAGIKLTVNGKTETPNSVQVVTLTINPSSKSPVALAAPATSSGVPGG